MRRIILTASGVYFALLAGLALLLYRASPGPSAQAILGIGIGHHDSEGGIVYLSGRHLRCGPEAADDPEASRCTVTIAGKTLEIRARRNAPPNPDQLGGAREAFYAGQQRACRIGSRHVAVHWFAYIDESLGLSAPQMDALRRQYWIENAPEWAFFPLGILAVSVTTTAVVLAGIAALPRPATRRAARSVALFSVFGTVTFVAMFFVALVLTRGFWD